MSKAQTSTVVILRSVKEQDKLIAQISNNRRALETQMHQAAVSVLWHVGQYKDVRQIDKLMTALTDADGSTSILTNSLIAWFEAFGPVMYDDNKFSYIKDKKLSLAQATDTPFWKFKPQKPYEALDVVAAIAAFVKRLEKDAKETDRDHSKLITAFMAVQKQAEQPAAQPKLQPAKAPKGTPSAAVIATAQKPAQLPLQ